MKEQLMLTAVRTFLPAFLGAFGALAATTFPRYYEAVCGAQAILPGIY